MKMALIIVYALVAVLGIIFWIGYDANQPTYYAITYPKHHIEYEYAYNRNGMGVQYAGILGKGAYKEPIFWINTRDSNIEAKLHRGWVVCSRLCTTNRMYVYRPNLRLIRYKTYLVTSDSPMGNMFHDWRKGYLRENLLTRHILLKTMLARHRYLPNRR